MTQQLVTIVLGRGSRFSVRPAPGGAPPTLTQVDTPDGGQLRITFHNGLTRDERLQAGTRLLGAVSDLVEILREDPFVTQGEAPLTFTTCPECHATVPQGRPHFCPASGRLADADGEHA